MLYYGVLMKDILTVKEAAHFLHKHPDTIRRWIESKKLPARKISAGGYGVYVMHRPDVLERMISGMIAEKRKRNKPKAPKPLPVSQVPLPM